MSGRSWLGGAAAVTALVLGSACLFTAPAGLLGIPGAVADRPSDAGSDGSVIGAAPGFSPDANLTAIFFTESGLRPGTNWSVALEGNNVTGAGTEIVFFEPKGTYTFRTTSPGYRAVPASGSISVSGKGELNESVAFTIEWAGPYSATFDEFGLPTGANWSVVLASTTLATNRSAIQFTGLAPGKYSVTIRPVPGYTAAPDRITLAIGSENVTRSIQFEPVPPGPPALGPIPLTPGPEFALFAFGAWCAWVGYVVVVDADYYRAAYSDGRSSRRTFGIALHVLGTVFAAGGLLAQLLDPSLSTGGPVIYGVVLLAMLLVAIVRRVGWWEPPYQPLPP
ncbi:MAG TPA: hypothetical protein VML94_03260 [Thermoplasmata archaeon]|nr:hypothetical protein [Thermoplasmata archaeon]